jgi:hypothetical protein
MDAQGGGATEALGVHTPLAEGPVVTDSPEAPSAWCRCHWHFLSIGFTMQTVISIDLLPQGVTSQTRLSLARNITFLHLTASETDRYLDHKSCRG